MSTHWSMSFYIKMHESFEISVQNIWTETLKPTIWKYKFQWKIFPFLTYDCSTVTVVKHNKKRNSFVFCIRILACYMKIHACTQVCTYVLTEQDYFMVSSVPRQQFHCHTFSLFCESEKSFVQYWFPRLKNLIQPQSMDISLCPHRRKKERNRSLSYCNGLILSSICRFPNIHFLWPEK
jgi:hypothetical protein